MRSSARKQLLPFIGRFAAAATFMILGIFCAIFGWMSRVPNPGVGYQETLDASGVPHRTIVHFSPLTNFVRNFASNALWILAFLCILASLIATVKMMRAWPKKR